MKIRGSWLLCALPTLTAVGCAVDAGPEPSGDATQTLEADGGECVLDGVTVSVLGSTNSSIEVEVCAGPSGAPNGFSLQWSSAGAFASAGHEWSGGECSAVFDTPLCADQCVTVLLGSLGEENGVCESCKVLECGTEYVVRGRAEESCDCKASEYSCSASGSTLECEDEGCTLTQGYWKNHPEDWPVSSLMLGSVSYSAAELLTILKTPPKGNGALSLAHQLIAAKLNLASGASGSGVTSDIAAADALLGSLVLPPGGSGYLDPALTGALNDALSGFNEGHTGPGHCDDQKQD